MHSISMCNFICAATCEIMHATGIICIFRRRGAEHLMSWGTLDRIVSVSKLDELHQMWAAGRHPAGPKGPQRARRARTRAKRATSREAARNQYLKLHTRHTKCPRLDRQVPMTRQTIKLGTRPTKYVLHKTAKMH